MGRRYCFEAVLEAVPARGGAYVRFPYDLRQEFGRGRVRVQADFDGGAAWSIWGCSGRMGRPAPFWGCGRTSGSGWANSPGTP